MRFFGLLLLFALSVYGGAKAGERVIAQEALTLTYLSELFASKGYEVALLDGNAGVFVEHKEGFSCFLHPEKDSMMVLVSDWPLKENTSELRKLRFMNDLNSGYSAAKAFFYPRDDPDTLFLQHDFPTAWGITEAQLLETVEGFLKAGPAILLEIDKNYEILK